MRECGRGVREGCEGVESICEGVEKSGYEGVERDVWVWGEFI